jgi:hypothetical protein
MGVVRGGEAGVSRLRAKRRSVAGVGLIAVFAGALWTQQARATENAASVYLLGLGGPGAAIMPPIQGVFFDNIFYYYTGTAQAGKEFVVGGRVVAGLNARVGADFATGLWAPTTDFFGATVTLGATLPFGEPLVDVSAVLTGPFGRQLNVSRSDSTFVAGDPLLTAAIGWKWGDFHLQGSTLVNVPIGEYHDGALANLAFHRWADDLSLAGTWHDDKVGWDVTGKVGVTFNGTNNVTHYTTGTEFHAEGAVEKTLSPAFSVGAQMYYFDQVTGDSGSGARLGPFEGRVTGAGGTAVYRFVLLKKIPATLRLRAMHEFDVTNRLQGTSVWLDFTMPLHVKMPTAAPAHE